MRGKGFDTEKEISDKRSGQMLCTYVFLLTISKKCSVLVVAGRVEWVRRIGDVSISFCIIFLFCFRIHFWYHYCFLFFFLSIVNIGTRNEGGPEMREKIVQYLISLLHVYIRVTQLL